MMKWIKKNPHLIFWGIAFFGFFVLQESFVYLRDQYASNWGNIRSIGVIFSPGAMIFSTSLAIGFVYWMAISTGRALNQYRTQIHLVISTSTCLFIMLYISVYKFIFPEVVYQKMISDLFNWCVILFLATQVLLIINLVTSKKESVNPPFQGILDAEVY